MDRGEALNSAMKQIEKQFGKGAVFRLGDDKAKMKMDVISTGILPLDIAIGLGGLPRGRIIEIYGPESSGKTTVALQILAEVQRIGGTAAFIDAEHAMDANYAKKLGIDVNSLIFSQPDSGEQGLEIVDSLIRSSAIDIVVIDSVAALVPQAEIDGDMGSSHVGLHARMMSQAMRKLAGTVSKTNTIAIFINQIREKVGVMFGNPETTTGGRALKFYSTIRMEVRKGEALKIGSDVAGNRIKIKIVKNKVAPPLKQIEVDLIYGSGISKEGCIIEAGVDQKIIDKNGAYLSYNGERLGQGKENAKKYLREHPEVYKDIEDKIREVAFKDLQDELPENIIEEMPEDYDETED
ncbi:MAG: recombinase RecA [Selenomonadaceae bacterium]|nr:recombinase RecA [Selenomonadaceae bacterium]